MIIGFAEDPGFVGDAAVGAAQDTRITGGDLFQPNGRPVQISGVAELRFVDGSTSHGVKLHALKNRAVLLRESSDVTAQIAVNPAPRRGPGALGKGPDRDNKIGGAAR